MNLLDSALAFTAAGCSVVPTRADGSKAPAAYWKQYQLRCPTSDELRSWLANGSHDGIGLITGSVSGHLEMFEVEGRAVTEGVLAELTRLLTDNGFADLWQRLNNGYLEATPSGGLHWLYRVDGEPARNMKLARRPATDAELAEKPDDKVKVLIETRGEGGYVVVAPSAGRTHPTGKPWLLVAGSPECIPLITLDERDALHAVASLLDRLPAKDEPKSASRPRQPGDPRRPGDDFNDRTDWLDILGAHGWTRERPLGRGYAWRRPGKDRGISATTGQSQDGADRLYVFSTSTVFETEKPYTKFAAHTLLEHGGDYSAAAKALGASGYGDPIPEQKRDLQSLVAPEGQTENQPDNMPENIPATYTRTDDGNALRLVDTYGSVLRYCPDRGSWLAWDGHRWTWDAAGTVNELARSIARNLPDLEKADARHRALSLSARSLDAMIRIARTDPRTVAPVRTLDAKPYELNTPNGVVDLRTGQLRSPDPKALHTRATTVAPEEGQPGLWLRFLADTFAGDPDLTTYVQRLLGVSLIGTVLEQVLPFAYGEGANGKTTLLGVVQRLIGLGDDGYAISAPAELLLATANTGHPTEIARLAGARLVVTSELDEGQRFAEAKVKQLTGRDAVAGRFMRQDWFSFTPTHTLWMLANHQPAVRTGGPAFWRRLRLVPFLHTVPTAQRDPHLEDRLVSEEGPAILQWLVDGARDYLLHGLPEPASVRTATDAYERDQDTVTRFVEDLCQTGDVEQQGMAVKVAELRSAYERWCSQEGEQPITQKALTLALRSRYEVESVRSKSTRYYRGIRLEETDSNLSPDPSSEGDDGAENWWQR